VKVKVKYTQAIIFLLSTCCASLSCGSASGNRLVGGACEYRQIHGRAIVTDVREADPQANNCKNAVEVVFAFAPDEPSAPGRYRFADHPDTEQYLRVGAGMNPPRAWVRREGLVTGSVHRCIRSEIEKGSCTPVVFSFPDLDTAGWKKACFG
jgi:hypothetical protein